MTQQPQAERVCPACLAGDYTLEQRALADAEQKLEEAKDTYRRAKAAVYGGTVPEPAPPTPVGPSLDERLAAIERILEARIVEEKAEVARPSAKPKVRKRRQGKVPASRRKNG